MKGSNINRLLNSTTVGKIVQDLDAQDGNKNGRIKASVWNAFVDMIGTGKKIKNEITLANALKSINVYTKRQANGIDKTAEDVATEWKDTVLADLGASISRDREVKSAPQPIDPIPSRDPIPPADIDQITQIVPPIDIEAEYNGASVADNLYDVISGAEDGEISDILENDLTPQNAKGLIESFNEKISDSGQEMTEYLDYNGIPREQCVAAAKKILEYPFLAEVKVSEEYKALHTAVNDFVQNGGREKAAAVDSALKTFINYATSLSDEIFMAEYDENDRATRRVLSNNNGDVEIVCCKYNIDGQGRDILVSYNKDGTIRDFDVVERPSNDKANRTRYHADGTVASCYDFSFDENNKMKERTSYNEDGTVRWSEHYDYSDKTRRETVYNSDGTIRRWELRDDQTGEQLRPIA